MFCGLLQESDDIQYEEVLDYKKVRTIVEEKLEDYNIEPELIAMDLSMFKDAIMHVYRIHKRYPSGQRQYDAGGCGCLRVRSAFAHPLSCIHSWNGTNNCCELGRVDLIFINYFPPGFFQH